MKILFAVSNENIADAIKREYQNNYKAQLLTKSVYYFNAIIKELQNNKTYDVVIVNEELEPFANNNYDTIDKFLADKLVTIREEAVNAEGNRLPVIFITSDRHMLGDFLTTKLYEIGIYNALVGTDRSIENVCTLMFHPRNKQEAKAYYRVNAEIDNGPREDDVKEEEIKNIILHYKKLGKAEERYVESFDNIASQYNDAQLKVIIRFLPLNVKAVLEAQSPKYQSLTTFANNYNAGTVTNVPQNERNNNIIEKNVSIDNTNNRVLEQISSVQNNSNVIIPNAMNINNVRKITDDNNTLNENVVSQDLKNEEMSENLMTRRKNDVKNISSDTLDNVLPGFEEDDSNDTSDNILPGFEENGSNGISDSVLPGFEENSSTGTSNNVLPGFEEDTSSDNSNNALPGFEESDNSDVELNEELIPTVKRGRGRPRKNTENVIIPQGPKRGRGRPRKNVTLEENINENDVTSVLPGIENESNAVQESYNNTLPGFSDDIQAVQEPQEAVLPDFGNDIESSNTNTQNNGINNAVVESYAVNNFDNHVETRNEQFVSPIQNIQNKNSLLEKQSVRYENIEYLIPADKRIATFIGTSKSGVSFIVNNLAQMLTSFNINVALLDLTKNKNSFYIYTNNDEGLRNKSSNSIYNLMEGKTEGIKVSKNLTIYTALPTDTEEFYEADKVLKTLIDNYSVVLIDADYDTPIGYFDNSTDLFMVQNMDILTMQPLTTFLKELKAKNILKDEKLRLIVNMESKIKGINSQVLLNALSVYKDPGMAYTVDLYNKEAVKLFTIPFDMEAYNKYLTTLVECNLSLTGYSKAILSSLKEVAACIYPLLSVGKGKKNTSYSPPSLNNYTSSPFNGDVNNTLGQMKNRY